MSDVKSQISEKIRELSEPNKKIEEKHKEAEKKMAEGYESKPEVERVLPKPKKEPKKVTVSRNTDEFEAVKKEDKEISPEEKSASVKEDSCEKKDSSHSENSFDKSLQEFEDLLTEESKDKKNTLFIEKEEAEKEIAKEKEKRAEGKGEVAPSEKPKTTVKENPRHKGLHTVKRRVAKTKEEEPQEKKVTETVYCLYEPLTGAMNELFHAVTVIGKSSEANIVINNRYVSGIHARVIKEEDGYYIEDIGSTGLGSTNGTKVNGIKIAPGIKGRTKLNAGDNITLAATNMIFDVKN